MMGGLIPRMEKRGGGRIPRTCNMTVTAASLSVQIRIALIDSCNALGTAEIQRMA